MRYSTLFLLALALAACSNTGSDTARSDTALSSAVPSATRGADSPAASDATLWPAKDSLPKKWFSDTYPPHLSDSERWDYHRELSHDLDGDGRKERLILSARADLPEGSTLDPLTAPRDSFDWDLHEPWQIWVEESSGERTYLYSNFLDGWMDVSIDSTSSVVLKRSWNGGSFTRYIVRYHAPGRAALVAIDSSHGSPR